jgi:hypothetical protein
MFVLALISPHLVPCLQQPSVFNLISGMGDGPTDDVRASL